MICKFDMIGFRQSTVAKKLYNRHVIKAHLEVFR